MKTNLLDGMKLIQNNEIQKNNKRNNRKKTMDIFGTVFLKIGGAFKNLFRERTENIEK